MRSREEVLRFLVFDTSFVNYYSYIKDWVQYGVRICSVSLVDFVESNASIAVFFVLSFWHY